MLFNSLIFVINYFLYSFQNKSIRPWYRFREVAINYRDNVATTAGNHGHINTALNVYGITSLESDTLNQSNFYYVPNLAQPPPAARQRR